MIRWFTGQPGHGKTLNALAYAMELRDKGRIVYVCNVRDFDYEKAGMLPMTPEQFRDWMNFLPDGAVALVDEAYEHGMLPKRPPSAKVPPHVEQLAKHRHRGLDFIFVSQSPDKQCDQFVHDLIERHIHVRRRFGTNFVHLRTFDRFEANPEKARPLSIQRAKLPKGPMGLYKSTEMDTTERKIPWYFLAFGIGAPLLLAFGWWTFSSIGSKLSGGQSPDVVALAHSADGGANGAPAKVASPDAAHQPKPRNYAEWLRPRIDGQPWTAPAYDGAQLPPKPPRVFCMASGHNMSETCSCLTEQGTVYAVDPNRCRVIARNGQYEPFRDSELADSGRIRDVQQKNDLLSGEQQRAPSPTADQLPASKTLGVGVSGWAGQQTRYGQFRTDPVGGDPSISSN